MSLSQISPCCLSLLSALMHRTYIIQYFLGKCFILDNGHWVHWLIGNAMPFVYMYNALLCGQHPSFEGCIVCEVMHNLIIDELLLKNHKGTWSSICSNSNLLRNIRLWHSFGCINISATFWLFWVRSQPIRAVVVCIVFCHWLRTCFGSHADTRNVPRRSHMMTSRHGPAFRITGPLWRIPPINGGFPSLSASNTGLYCLLCS